MSVMFPFRRNPPADEPTERDLHRPTVKMSLLGTGYFLNSQNGQDQVWLKHEDGVSFSVERHYNSITHLDEYSLTVGKMSHGHVISCCVNQIKTSEMLMGTLIRMECVVLNNFEPTFRELEEIQNARV